MELISTARIIRARERADVARPYSRELAKAIAAAATYNPVNHPLPSEKTTDSNRAAVLVVTSDRRPVAGSWVGHSDRPTYDVARDIGDTLIQQFLTENTGVDDVHLAYTRFHSMLNHELISVRMLPTEVVEGIRVPDPHELLPLYESSLALRRSSPN